jgi:hypothetical protein
VTFLLQHIRTLLFFLLGKGVRMMGIAMRQWRLFVTSFNAGITGAAIPPTVIAGAGGWSFGVGFGAGAGAGARWRLGINRRSQISQQHNLLTRQRKQLRARARA